MIFYFMDWNSLTSGLVGTLIGVFLTSFINYFGRVREARSLRIMLSREIEENMHLLSQFYTIAPVVFVHKLSFPSFRFSIWDSGAVKAPSFLHKHEISSVNFFYRQLRDISELTVTLSDANPEIQTMIIEEFKQKGYRLGRTGNPVGKQKLNFVNYYFFLSKIKGNTVGEGNYHHFYPQGVYFSRSYDRMPCIQKILARTKDFIYQIWYI